MKVLRLGTVLNVHSNIGILHPISCKRMMCGALYSFVGCYRLSVISEMHLETCNVILCKCWIAVTKLYGLCHLPE